MPRFIFLLALLVPGALLAQPTAPDRRRLDTLRADSAPTGRAAATLPLSVNTSSREEVRQFYFGIYHASEGVPMNWTGSYTTGAAGDTASAYKEATLLRINFFRALAGVPAAVALNPTFNGKAQQAALMMSANNTLQHTGIPTSWTFYTAQGAEAAASSNLALGLAGPDAITGYIEDSGANNATVGHRRWLLYPQTREMGT
ncbi:MAG TPA: CAP domain-containing protein, partial [Opitutus sp.]|nr:CAP domain-containing protein [Opitutus sp.]